MNMIHDFNKDRDSQSLGITTNRIVENAFHQTLNRSQDQCLISMNRIHYAGQEYQHKFGMSPSRALNSQVVQFTPQIRHRKPQFMQYHAKMEHELLIQQMRQRHQNSFIFSNNDSSHINQNNAVLKYQQNKAEISKAQTDSANLSEQNFNVTNDIYHLHINSTNEYGISYIYSKNDIKRQEHEIRKHDLEKGLTKSISQPQLFCKDNCDSICKPHQTNVSLEAMEKNKISTNKILQIRNTDVNNSVRANGEDSTFKTNVNDRIEITPCRKDNISKNSNFHNRNLSFLKGHTHDKEQDKKDFLEVQDSKVNRTRFHKEYVPLQENETVLTSLIKTEKGQTLSNKSKMENHEFVLDHDGAEQHSLNFDSGRGSTAYSSYRIQTPRSSKLIQEQDAEWVDVVESELRNIFQQKDFLATSSSTLSDSASSVTPPLPPLTPHHSPKIPVDGFSENTFDGSRSKYKESANFLERKKPSSSARHSNVKWPKIDATKKFHHLLSGDVADLTSTTTGLDLDSMLDRSDSDLSVNEAKMTKKQVEGLENMYSEVLKLLDGNKKKKKKICSLVSYGSVSSLPTSSLSSRPIVVRHHEKRKFYNIDKIQKSKNIKTTNKRFQRLESHVVTLARSVAHLSSEMRTQHIMLQEIESLKGDIATLRAQTNMAMIRSQSQIVINNSELPALSNPYRVKKLTQFFGMEPPLLRLFLRELGYEKYAAIFEKEKIGMIELPYLSEERMQKIGIPLGPRLRILQEARISVSKDPVYVV